MRKSSACPSGCGHRLSSATWTAERVMKPPNNLACPSAACTAAWSAAASSTMVLSTAEAAVQFASGGLLNEALISKELLSLTQEVLRTMLLAKIKLVLSAILCVGV